MLGFYTVVGLGLSQFADYVFGKYVNDINNSKCNVNRIRLHNYQVLTYRQDIRVSIRGVKSLWVDRRFIPADQGSYWVICAICSF